MRFIAIAAAALLAAGCSTAPGTARPDGAPIPPAAGAVTSITYETGPCFGFCPVYRVTVNADGSGMFEGIRNTAFTGPRAFTVTRAQYGAFAAHLASLRPASGSRRLSGPEECASYVSDMPSATVTWRGAAGDQSLYLDYGCDRDGNRAMAEKLRTAPDLLPIAEMTRRTGPGVR